MRALFVAVLSYGAASFGIAFAPSGMMLPTGSSAYCCARRSFSTQQFLFSPEHGDHSGPIAVVSPKKAEGKTVAPAKAGGWGSWAKVVSQREEQEEVLRRFAGSISQGAGRGAAESGGLVVRTGQKSDMFSISHLCVDIFRGPYEWFMLPVQLFQEFTFFGQVNGRLGRVTRNEIQHSMVVAEDTKSGKVVGFLEIGMLPKPTPSEESALAGETEVTQAAISTTAVDNKSSAADGGDGGDGGQVKGGQDRDEDGVWAGSSFTKISPDVAYLANVVVDRRQRRRGIGRTMVNSAIEIVRELWPEEKRIYVSVEQGNDVAVALYEGMGFELAALEDEMLARSRNRPARIYLFKSLYT